MSRKSSSTLDTFTQDVQRFSSLAVRPGCPPAEREYCLRAAQNAQRQADAHTKPKPKKRYPSHSYSDSQSDYDADRSFRNPLPRIDERFFQDRS